MMTDPVTRSGPAADGPQRSVAPGDIGEERGVAVYAVSYDPVATLARFAETHGISYPLLSDVDSATITGLGLLNTTMEQERAAYGRPMEDRHRGVPYPGSFVLDEGGVVVSKRFEQSHRIRPTAATLLGDAGPAAGHRGDPDGAVTATLPGVRLSASLDTTVVYANQLQEVHLRFRLDDGVHLYTEPVPPGFTALTVGLSGDDRMQAEPATLPAGHEFRVDGLDETFQVVAGTFDVPVPFFLLSNRDTAGDPTRSLTVAVDVIYQACTDTTCFVPERVRLDLALTEEPNPGYETAGMAALAPLAVRRIVEQPRTADELMVLLNAALAGGEVGPDDVTAVLADLEERRLITVDGRGRWASRGGS